MFEIVDNLLKIQEQESPYKKFSLPTQVDRLSELNKLFEIPMVEIDEKKTFPYQMKQEINRIIEKSNEHTKLLVEQNNCLQENYKKLEQLYNLKDIELKEAKEDAKKAKIYNIIMMIVSIISMLVAAAAWVFPNILDILGGILQ